MKTQIKTYNEIQLHTYQNNEYLKNNNGLLLYKLQNKDTNLKQKNLSSHCLCGGSKAAIDWEETQKTPEQCNILYI